jgi:pimeloyl-ACP methyl ester carboxylesterase
MDIRWDAVGEAHGTAVLLHGVGASADAWWRVGPALADRGWQVFAPDLPAHGDCPGPREPLTLDLLAEEVAARLPQVVDLVVGHSLGALVGATLAARCPGSIAGVVLEDPPGLAEISPLMFAELIAHDAAQAHTDPGALGARLRSLNPRWAEKDVDAAVGGLRRVDTAAVVAGLRDGLRWDIPAVLRAAGCPALVLAASERGSALRGAERRAVRAAVPSEQFHVLDGGHALHRDQPEAWVAAVAEFGAAAMTATVAE